MRFPLPQKRLHWITLGIIVPMLTVLLLISGLFPWSPLNCWHEDVDINTGRVRHTRYLLFCQIGDRIEETWLFRANSNSNVSPDWRCVNTFSPGLGHSSHYHFHGAIHQINTLGLADNVVPFDPNARHKVAHRLLTLWQNSGSHFDADEFVEKVVRTAFTLHNNGASVFTASDVPTD
ncbi:hypothetical protein Q31b_58210 [Novipirellula aureliae]|uniref:Uncharacterized protein n=1 Tax=Novipirellula aureliae TaxID=2527966 RepID=A0A5C6D665_9BACT|nr:hypothetical protein [Novipirellula aureliae]TWU32663.1 hypothetical protein Q31b_58210 [Novipirellula aureliae]